jgi:DNA repair protein RadC
MSAITENKHAVLSSSTTRIQSIEPAPIKELLNQDVLRVILLDTRDRQISTVEITKGSINESLAHPRGST